jgi:serine/threonine protein phosphatase 1
MVGLSSRRNRGPAGARDWRAYVIGDVHGRLDLLDQLLAKIHSELDRHRTDKALIVFVGDLIDRGPASAQVVERLRTYRRDNVRTMFLLGNHEEVLLRILARQTGLVAKWRSFGGSECLESYGVDAQQFAGQSEREALDIVGNAIPDEHRQFLGEFVDTCRFGDYLFVHAGIRPGIEIDQQRQSDLRWIRELFLLDDSDHGVVVVHGHTISPEVEVRRNRIGIDTGAYRTGVLTALAIDGPRRWFLDTRLSMDKEVTGIH